jgi:hypothetical protein
MLHQSGRHARVAAISNISVQAFDSFESLPDPVAAFFNHAGERDFFQSIPWYRTVLRDAGPKTDQVRIYAAEAEGRPIAVLVVRKREAAGRLKTHMLLSPSNGPYATISGPLLDGERGPEGLRAIAAAIGRTKPSFDVLRFDCLDRRSREFEALGAAFRGSVMLVRPFENFTDHYVDVQGQEIEHLLAQRSRVMRDYVHHTLRDLADSRRGRFELFTGGPAFKSVLVDYALVDVQSWQDQEIYPNCTIGMIEAAAGIGALRLGLFYVDDEPAAAQIWIVCGARATIWRTRYAKKFATLGTVPALTFEMFRHALEVDHVAEINSGAGDDKIMQMWFERTRQRGGLLVFNPRTLKGWVAAAGHMVGARLMAWARRAKGVLGRLLTRTKRAFRQAVPRRASVEDAG